MKRRFSFSKDKGCELCEHYQSVVGREYYGCFCDGDGYYMFDNTTNNRCPDWALKFDKDLESLFDFDSGEDEIFGGMFGDEPF